MKSTATPATPPAFDLAGAIVVTGYRHATGRTVGHHQPASTEPKAPVHRFTTGRIYLDTVAPEVAAKAAAEAEAAAKKSRTAAEAANEKAAAAILTAEAKPAPSAS